MYHISHHDVLWSPWLQLEHKLKSNMQLTVTSVPDLTLTVPVALANTNEEESDETIAMREKFFQFYKPTREEVFYGIL